MAKAMAKVDKSSTLDLANSDVLHQSKMELRDISQRSARGPHMDPFRSQVRIHSGLCISRFHTTSVLDMLTFYKSITLFSAYFLDEQLISIHLKYGIKPKPCGIYLINYSSITFF